MSTYPSPQRTRLALVGAGSVGTAVAYQLRAAGGEVVAVTSRSKDSADRGSQLLGAPAVDRLGDLPVADLVLVGVSESSIGAVARDLALHVAPGTIVVHFAGAFGLEPLDPLASSGARPAALHPVQAIPDFVRGIERLPGSAWGVTTAPDIHDWAHALIRNDLQGEPFDVAEEDRALWHAASVTTANSIAALMGAGERILGSIGVTQPDRVLGPLAAGTVANAILGGGGSATLTGPVARAERAIIERHLEALAERAPELVGAYKLAAWVVLEEAETNGRVDAGTALELRALLGGRS